MGEEKPKRKNDAEVYIGEWVKAEQGALRWLAASFVLISLCFLILVNPFQYSGYLESDFLIFSILLISIAPLGAIALFILSNNQGWIRNLIDKIIENQNNNLKLFGPLFLVTAAVQFFSGGAEQKLIIAPCFVAIAIYSFWRYQKFQRYLALIGEEEAK